MSVGHVAPEAAAGGPLALVRDGDVICIDLDERRLDVDLSDQELAVRRSTLGGWQRDTPSRWLRRYARAVGSASRGAVLLDPESKEATHAT
jgi:dihydroxy-acid dehydratase